MSYNQSKIYKKNINRSCLVKTKKSKFSDTTQGLKLYQNYSPVLILTIFAVILIALPLVIQYLISPRQNKGGEKLIPYECGEIPEGSAWVKFNIRFYIIALIFIIFDVEVIFMYPWALVYKEFGLLGFLEMLLFVSILLVGLFYVWRKGDLDWVKMQIRNPKGRYKDLVARDK